MNAQFEQRLEGLRHSSNNALLRHIRRGIEKESLRITPQGRLAQTPHPPALGSALTHAHITTDYSESLLEFITSPNTELKETLGQLNDIHRFVYAHLQDELLWTSSMPCVLTRESEIPVAQYGSSNVARMKTIYRLGLGHRYGRQMQTISGIHYNFSLGDVFWEWLLDQLQSPLSLQDFKTEQYFALIRNFHRFSWLLVYLFGASPALCESFVAGRNHALQPFTRGTLYAPHATSLRMGDLGYQSNAQRSIDIPYNSLDDYVSALHKAITTAHPDYVKIGVQQGDEWLQLSTSLLQIENEFYATIRPKRVTHSGESPRHALTSRGVEYIEVRCLDLNPFLPNGIDTGTGRFIDAFLLYCLLNESPLSDSPARERARSNLRLVVSRGREPGLELQRRNGTMQMRQWGLRMLEDIAKIGQLLDQARNTTDYQDSMVLARQRLEDPEQTPSARVVQQLRDQDISFYRFAMQQAEQHRDHFLAHPLSAAQHAEYTRMAAESLADQRAVESGDTVSFADYLANFYNQ